MKFNWRANWEILLVLVIIVVGIVITTIAAIRNKDKHLLALPEETDFGQPLAVSDLSETTISAPQQTDPHSNNAQVAQQNSDDDHSTWKQQLHQPSIIKSTRPSTYNSVVRDQQQNYSNHRNQNSANTNGIHHDGRQSKHGDDQLDIYNSRLTVGAIDHQQQVTISPAQANVNIQDSYDALNTEPTPSQTRSETGYVSSNSNYHYQNGAPQNQNGSRQHHSGNRRHINKTPSTRANDDSVMLSQPYGDQIGESADLNDDIHTTRSSLATRDNEANRYTPGNLGIVIPTPQVDQMPIISSSPKQAPYGVTPSPVNQVSKLVQQSVNNKQQAEEPSASILDSEDMMTSYSKIPNNNSKSINELLRDYNLASVLSDVNSNNTNQQLSQQQLVSSTILANFLGLNNHDSANGLLSQSQKHQQQQFNTFPLNHHNHRTYSSTVLPISVSLGDLFKSTKPQQLAHLPAVTEQSVNNRVQLNILQQLRSLPGPLLSLLQGISPSSIINLNELGSTNNDASESNQHYHRISMGSPTDIHSILAQSLGNSSILPAYPAPKGTPQSWIPPTAGGDPSYQAAHNSNADFVASNAAGFVRAIEIQQQEQNQHNAQQNTEQANFYQYAQQQPHNSYQRQIMSNEPTFYSQAGDIGQQGSIDGGGGTHQQQQPNNPFSNIDQASTVEQQSLQQHHQKQQQQLMYTSNPMPGSVNPERNWVQSNGAMAFTGQNGEPQATGINELPMDGGRMLKGTISMLSQGNPQDYTDYINFHSQNNGRITSANPSQPFNMVNDISNGQIHQSGNKYPAYNSRLTNEMQVPLGYSPSQVSLAPQQQNFQQPRLPFEFNTATVESSPKISIANPLQISNVGSNSGQQIPRHQPQQQKQQHQVGQAKGLTRRKRTVGGHNLHLNLVDEVMSRKYNAGYEDEDGDSQPISVMRPDSQPMDSGRVRGFPVIRDKGSHPDDKELMRDPHLTQSQRSPNHLDLKQKSPYTDRYMSSYDKFNVTDTRPSAQKSKLRSKRPDEFANYKLETPIDPRRSTYREAKREFNGIRKNLKSGALHLDTASSGLMSKLLGTASTNDEFEEDMDDDDDATQEKRKEIEDTEFGIVNDERQANSPLDVGKTSNNNNSPQSQPQSEAKFQDARDSSSLGSRHSIDNEAQVARRHQQRSDIEFYGHPGEETRRLKYGILGSGNYEVVNGGIYSEADESTAAVNSVANYVRKPGALLAGLPKLIVEHAGGHHEHLGPQAAYMPGGRIDGILRGGSLSSNELVGFVPNEISKDLSSPLLELIDSNGGGYLLDSNSLAQLGSSGSSAQSIHTSHEGGNLAESQNSINNSKHRNSKNGKVSKPISGFQNYIKFSQKLSAHKKEKSKQENETDRQSEPKENEDIHVGQYLSPMKNSGKQLQQQQSSINGARSRGANQFNSYQILPSKKVTIFSDQDLDSAPSEHRPTGIIFINMSDDSSNRTDVSTIHLDNISLMNRENVDSNSKFIGFDLSTQQLKAIVIDDRLKICHNVNVNFDEELGEYKTKGGVYKSEDGSNTVTTPVNMWLKSLDICFDKLKIDGLDFSTVIGISGCAQQHGSVWWRHGSAKLLANLNSDEYLHKALVSAFSLRDTPIWMDSSTSEECKIIENYVGGPKKLAQITGSRAYERFTGPQIAKIFRRRREVYTATERIALISNFFTSVLIGSYAPLDASDASGMNMMDIRTKRWSELCLEALVDGNQAEVAGLRARLGCLDSAMNDNIVDTHEVVGRVSCYFVERYGFPPECLISSFTGDNPGSMAGLCVGKDELIVSLGTSDTAFFWLEHPHPGVNGHVLRNPLDDSQYMGLICFKNGSKTRERIRDTCASGNWEQFSSLLNSVPRGNFGNIGFYYDLREIYPLCIGDFRYNKLDQRVESFSNELEIRACLEGQFMRLYHHSQALGLDMKKLRRVLVTGGASVNRAILQVVADIFHLPVYALEIQNSASLGAAYLAKYAYELEQQKLDQSFENSTDVKEKPINFIDMVLGSDECDKNLVKMAEPTSIASVDVYEFLLKRYTKLEDQMSLNNEDFI